MKRIILFILCLLLITNITYAVAPTPIPGAESFTFIDLLHTGSDKELIIFQDGVYYGTYNYSDPVFLNPDVNYTIIIDENYKDLIQDESFYTEMISRYGNVIISIIILISLIGFFVFIYNKMKGK